MIQPPHFLAEVAAVLIRETPESANADLMDLIALEWNVLDQKSVYGDAMKLSADLSHHLFDTLYHATARALDDGVLVTADRRYWRNAGGLGDVIVLSDFKATRR